MSLNILLGNIELTSVFEPYNINYSSVLSDTLLLFLTFTLRT